MYQYKTLKSRGGEKEVEAEEEKEEEEEEEKKEEKTQKGKCIGADGWETDSVQGFTLRLSFLIYKMGEMCLSWVFVKLECS